MSRRDEILAGVDAVDELPATAMEALRLLQDPDVEVAELTKVIEFDPGLTTNVLRLANSAYFGFTRTVNSIGDAVVLLGLKQVARTVTTAALGSMAQRPVRGYGLEADALWEHSIAVAVGSDKLVDVLGLTGVPDYVFTSALLHDIGKIVLGTFIEIDGREIMKLAFQDHISFEIAEQRVLGTDHAEVGAALLDSWKLPEPIVSVCRWHHSPENVTTDDVRMAVDLVHTADNLSMMAGIGTGSDGLNYRPSRDVNERMNLKTTVIEEVVCQVLDSLKDLRAVFAADKGGD